MTPQGELIDETHWQQHANNWLPSDEDQAYVSSLMIPVTEPGEFAGWISPPRIGINEQAIEYRYVDL